MSNYPSPVIFVPGIMGSELRDEYPVAPETVWSPFRLIVKSFDRITLHPDDTRYELVEPARVVKDQVFELIYRELIDELRHNLTQKADEPVPVFPFAYDWRQPLAQTQEQLGEFIKEVIDRTRLLRHYHRAKPAYTARSAKVSLIGHSMGGLIIAGYLKQSGFDRVDKVATIASPFRGSLEAIAKVAIGVGGIGLLPGSSREREAARVTPALYHLLPSFEGAVQPDKGRTENIYSASSWQPAIIETLSEFIRLHGLNDTDAEARGAKLLTDLLAEARKHRDGLESLVLDNPKNWLCIAGLGAETRVRASIQRDAEGSPRFVLSDEVNRWEAKGAAANSTDTGDNTVPFLGAEPGFLPRNQMVCVTSDEFGFFEFADKLLAHTGLHGALPNMNLVQRLIVSHLSGRMQGDLKGRPAPGVNRKDWDPPIAQLNGNIVN